jgi:hypothetical protein
VEVDNEEIILALLNKGADMEREDPSGTKPLDRLGNKANKISSQAWHITEYGDKKFQFKLKGFHCKYF